MSYFYPRSPCGERHGFKTLPRRFIDFYPRSPCGERQVAKRTTDIRPLFLSTLSLRRATPERHQSQAESRHFYPRSPCGERRPASHLSKFNTPYFYPRSPCGERLEKVPADVFYSAFLSTLSLRRATGLYDTYAKVLRVFLSTLSLRRATNAVRIA